VSEVEQIPRHRVGRRPVVETDARVDAGRIDAPGQYIRTAVAIEQRKQRRIVIEPHEHERVDAVLHHLLRDSHLGRQIVVMRGQHERIAARVGLALQRAGRAGVQRIVERRNDRADHVAATAAQRPRRAIGHVTQLLDRRAHARERRRIDGLRQVECARHRGRRYAGEARDVACARALGARRDVVGRRPRHGFLQHTRGEIDCIGKRVAGIEHDAAAEVRGVLDSFRCSPS
jgi:hypothetical protein